MTNKKCNHITTEFTKPIKSADAINDDDLVNLGQVKTFFKDCFKPKLDLKDNKIILEVGDEKSEVEIEIGSKYNFDIEADWNRCLIDNKLYPIINENSFKYWLTYGNLISPIYNTNFSYFNIVGNRLMANFECEEPLLNKYNGIDLSNINVKKILSCNVKNLNSLTIYDSKIEVLNLNKNLFNSEMKYLNFYYCPYLKKVNMNTNFSNAMSEVDLGSCQIESFEAEEGIYLDSAYIFKFDLSNNNLNHFDIPIIKSLEHAKFYLNLSGNKFTTDSYDKMETWANNLPNYKYTLQFNLDISNNPDKITSKLKSILESKNITVKS